jgi:serine/threonine protein kinase
MSAHSFKHSLWNTARVRAEEPQSLGSAPSRLGTQIGHDYRLVRQLASGAMSEVYLAEHVRTGAYAAVKLQCVRGRALAGLLTHEAQLLSRVQHPNVVRALEHGRLRDGTEYLVLEQVSGIDLADWLSECGSLPVERALHVLHQLASATDHLHGLGIVHSDIKPANLMLDTHRGDLLKLIDFGVAFDLKTERERRGSAGTPGYMAPEQLRGEACSPVTDRYALAAVGHELITGRPRHVLSPFKSKRGAPRSAGAMDVPGERCAVAGFGIIFERALHEDASLRFSTALAFVNALERAHDRACLVRGALPSKARTIRVRTRTHNARA